MASTTSLDSQASTTPDVFESIYAGAGRDAAQVPWDHGRASSALVNWLNVVAPSLIRCGARVGVPGCGLGHDARELARRGYDVTAFDCSESAIEWARDIDPRYADSFVRADLFQPPLRWRHRFDLVVEVNTLQSLPPDTRLGAMSAVADLLSPRGHLLVICHGADETAAIDDGPPWPLTEPELIECAALAGLTPEGPISCFMDDEDGIPVLRMRAVFKKT